MDLHEAAGEGNLWYNAEFLDVIFAVDARDNHQWSSLHAAAYHGYVDIVRDLLKAGADINVRNDYQETPLHIAARGGDKNVVYELLKAGADSNACDGCQCTPLWYAEKRDLLDVVQLLKDWLYYQRGIAKLGSTSAQVKDHTIEQIHEIAEQERKKEQEANNS